MDIFSIPDDIGKFKLIYDKGCWHSFFEAQFKRKYVKAIEKLLLENGYWINSAGSSDHKDQEDDPNKNTYPRLSLTEIATHTEDLFKIELTQKGMYGKNEGKDFITWETVFKKR